MRDIMIEYYAIVQSFLKECLSNCCFGAMAFQGDKFCAGETLAFPCGARIIEVCVRLGSASRSRKLNARLCASYLISHVTGKAIRVSATYSECVMRLILENDSPSIV